MMKIINHRLHQDDGRPVPFRSTPNVGGEIRRPRWLVMHYTAGGSASESINWLCDRAAKASAHLVIGRDGSITQLVPFDRVAWHAGVSTWKGVDGLNPWSIGIEMDGYGFLSGKPGAWMFRGQRVPDAGVLQATHRHERALRGWARYPAAQLAAAREVSALLVRTYGMDDVVGHDDIAPGRKLDPGPAFDMSDFRASVMLYAPPAIAPAQPLGSGGIGVPGLPRPAA